MDDSFHQDVSELSRRMKDQMANRNLESLSSMVRVTQKEVRPTHQSVPGLFYVDVALLVLVFLHLDASSLQKLLYHLPIPE